MKPAAFTERPRTGVRGRSRAATIRAIVLVVVPLSCVFKRANKRPYQSLQVLVRLESLVSMFAGIYAYEIRSKARLERMCACSKKGFLRLKLLSVVPIKSSFHISRNPCTNSPRSLELGEFVIRQRG